MDEILKYRGALFGIAAIWILLFHNAALTFVPNNEWLTIPASMGYFGVDIFVFLSGAGLYYSFTKSSVLREFYRKRFLRLLPAYYMALFLVIIVAFFVHFPGIAWAKQAIKHMLLFDFVTKGELSYLWFFNMIICLYLIYPLWYRLQKNAPYLRSIFLALLLTSVFYVVTVLCDAEDTLWLGFNTRFFIFLLGSILAQATSDKKFSIFIPQSMGTTLLFISMSTIIILLHDYLQAFASTEGISVIFLAVYGLLTIFIILPSFISLLRKLGQYTISQKVITGLSVIGTISLECYIVDQGMLREFLITFNPATPNTLLFSLVLITYILVIAVFVQQLTRLAIKLLEGIWTRLHKTSPA